MDLLSILQAYPVATVAIVIVIGLLVGSFLNVVIYRLPVMMEREWKSECKLILDPDSPGEEPAEPFNLAFPNSHCPNCDAPIRAWQNIPVISYVLLRGQCANCKVSISARYPIIEAVTALMSAVIAWQLGASLEMLAALFFTWSLIASNDD